MLKLIEKDVTKEESLDCYYCVHEIEKDEDCYWLDDGTFQYPVCLSCIDEIYKEGCPELILALSDFFHMPPHSIARIEEHIFEIGKEEYIIATEEQANKMIISYLEENLWAFNPSFLATVTGLDEVIFKALYTNTDVYSHQQAVLALLKGTDTSLESVAKQVIEWDGRGVYLASYDEKEIELSVGDANYFLYRVN